MTMLSFSNCTDNVIGYKIILVPYAFFFYGVKIIGTNLLCHRYLLERAKIVNIRGNDNVKHAFAKKLRNLETLFKWEIRLLAFPILGAVIGTFHSKLGFLCGAMGTLLVFVCDTLFSVTVTYVFQEPIASYSLDCTPETANVGGVSTSPESSNTRLCRHICSSVEQYYLMCALYLLL